jgi:hypothetical protein
MIAIAIIRMESVVESVGFVNDLFCEEEFRETAVCGY